MAAQESKRARVTRMHDEYDRLCAFIPVTKCQLDYTTPFELIVATVLSAQTTDKRVNSVTPALFAQYPDADALAQANIADVESIIRVLGFYRMKSKHIIELAQALVARFGGEVPHTMDELTSLPGVGRKTANVVLGNAFGVPGFPVDTHVIRVTGRLGWRDTAGKPSPEAIERDITACFPREEWTDLSHRLIIFGRSVCTARAPQCAWCPLNDSCPSAGDFLGAAPATNRAHTSAKRARASAKRTATRTR
ncbi:endonuclease III [Bifidobacterium criceti]|uniref:Endonuclease III n=1 Tax=Bifidobacterium criceti TaxID=1960969 RepID=A0A2A2EHL7_9BIFI|nr:endonuclease III [Bifidobacterium criceti]PAU68553.1 EndoIII-related endonuclease [Bifidobacterium criceti]